MQNGCKKDKYGLVELLECSNSWDQNIFDLLGFSLYIKEYSGGENFTHSFMFDEFTAECF